MSCQNEYTPKIYTASSKKLFLQANILSREEEEWSFLLGEYRFYSGYFLIEVLRAFFSKSFSQKGGAEVWP
jgi:hypothetical protein